METKYICNGNFHGSSCQLTCLSATFISNYTSSCEIHCDNGNWVGECYGDNLYCHESCQTLPVVSNHLECDTTEIGGICKHKCSENSLSTDIEIFMCQPGGVWSRIYSTNGEENIKCE